jgi:hypothetical protein
MRHLVEQLEKLSGRLRSGGGAARVEKQHRAGKMTASPRWSIPARSFWRSAC